MAQDTFFSSKKTLNIRGNAVSLQSPLVMGIINATPDSFYAGSRAQHEDDLLIKFDEMIRDGAHIIDIGGYSSRPGADDVTESEETDRVVSAIELLRNHNKSVFISVDTFRSKVAEAAIDAGADIINDISGGQLDKHMHDTVARLHVPYILMHMRGTPQTMTTHSSYDNLILELVDYFQQIIGQLKSLGVKDVIIDPGFGFSKTIQQNFELLSQLSALSCLELPILVGLSRKSMIYKSLNIKPEEALNGSTALNMIALLQGASILRVHDVKEAAEAVELYKLTYIK